MTGVDGLDPAVAAFCEGHLSPVAFQAAFERAQLWVQRVRTHGAPSVVAVGPEGAGLVAVHTSAERLAAYAGECDWASASGGDLLELVPDGYGVVVDPGGPFTVVLPAAAIRRGVVVVVAPIEVAR